jgi:hypothetical protein
MAIRLAEECLESLDRNFGHAKNTPKRSSVQLGVHRDRHWIAPIANQSHVTSSLTRLSIPEPFQRGDTLSP